MNRLPMSRAAAGLLRALIGRMGEGSRQIVLTDVRSDDWQSLTFAGERHCFEFRLTGGDSGTRAKAIATSLESIDFAIPGQIVADITATELPAEGSRTSSTLRIEALTIEE